MASCVDSNLMPQEKVLYRAQTSLWSLIMKAADAYRRKA